MFERTNIKQGEGWIGRHERMSLFTLKLTFVLFKILRQGCIHILLW